LSFGDRSAARAVLGLRDVLGDPRRRSGPDVGDLVTALRGDRLAGQALPAAAALHGREEQPLVRVVHQPHRRAGLAGLLPRRTLPLLAQRPVLRLLPERAVRRRRPRRRRGIPAGPAGSSGTARNHATNPKRQPPETANRNYPVTSNNTLTLAE